MEKIPMKGFQRFNPEIVAPKKSQTDHNPSSFALDEEGQHKLMLAEKLISGEKMTKTEKRQIYKYLTGKNAPPSEKKGRPSELYNRDISLAWEYLVASSKGAKKAGDVMKELAIAYKMPGLENVKDDTFYKAVNNGIAILESSAKEWMLSVTSGDYDDMAPKKRNRRTAKARLTLALIKKYRK